MPLSTITTNSIADDAITVPKVTDQILTNRNLIINGAMQVNQRGDTTGVTTSQYGGPDRFKFGIATAGTFDISQSTTAPNGFANSYKLDCTTADASLAAGDLVAAQTRIEGQDLQQLKKGTSDAESVTLSFYVRSNKTGTYALELLDNHNNRQVTKTYTISSADTFEYKSITFPADTTGPFNDNNSVALTIIWWLGAGTNYTSGTATGSWAASTAANRAVGLNVNIADNTANEWLITGVQLELGDTATPFEHRSFGDELARCQRYYFKSGQQWMSGQSYGINNSLDGLIMPIYWPTTMRANPSVSFSGGSDGGSFAALYTAYVEEEGMSVNLRSTNAATSVWWSGFRVTADSEI